ncbi:hypothetical protein TWF103_008913 [Orbilia oligospora]|nr:hypothetical protein TWF103_008913 [Orbilia oligospora]
MRGSGVCHTAGKVEFGARFGTSWWWLKEASVHFSAKDSKLVTDIQAKVEIEGSKEWKKELTSVLLSQFAIPGILNFGPELTFSAEFNFDLANVLAFGPSTIKGPEVNVGAYLKDAKVKPHLSLLLGSRPKFLVPASTATSSFSFRSFNMK